MLSVTDLPGGNPPHGGVSGGRGTWARGRNVNKVIFYFNLQKRKKTESETQTRRYERMNYGAAAVQSGRGKRLKCARNMREATGRMMYARMCYMYVRVQLYLASSQKCTSMFIDN